MSNQAKRPAVKRFTGKRSLGMFSVAALGSVTIFGGIGIADAATHTNTVVDPGPSTGPVTTIFPAKTAQPVASETFTVTNAFTAGDSIAIDVGTAIVGAAPAVAYSPGPPVVPATPAVIGTAANNSTTPGDYVDFATTPTITVTPATGNATTDTTPTLTGTLSTNPLDSPTNKNAAVTDQLNLAFANNSTGTAGDTYTVTLTGIAYTTGATAGSNTGDVPVDITEGADTSGVLAPTADLAQNAQIADVDITEAPTGVAVNGPDNSLDLVPVATPVSNIVLTELVPDTVTDTVTITPAEGTFTGTPTVTATGAVVSAATLVNGNITFNVTTPSTTTPATFTISGINYLPGLEGAEPVLVSYGPDSPPTVVQTAQPAITVVGAYRSAGATADDTAADNAEAYATSYASQNSNSVGVRTVLLTSDAGYQDALSASYLTNELSAPILLNPPTVPAGGEASTAAAGAIRAIDAYNADHDAGGGAGVDTVDIIGGPDAISPAVATALAGIQTGVSDDGLPIYMTVNRIAGETAEDTAEQVAQYPATNPEANLMQATPGAYGRYNGGMSESSAIAANVGYLKTAIVASGDEFQDALAASGLAADDASSSRGYPILLTSGATLSPQVTAGLNNLGIQQVIVVGGTDVVSAADVTALEADGVSVLRIAGQTFSDTANELASFELSAYAPGGHPGPVPGPIQHAGTLRQHKGVLGRTEAAPVIIGTGIVDGLDVEGGSSSITVATSRGDSPYDALSASPILGYEGDDGPIPLLLNLNTTTAGPDTLAFFGEAGTSPDGGFTVYNADGTSFTTSIDQLAVFGGTLAQPRSLVQSEISAIAAG